MTLTDARRHKHDLGPGNGWTRTQLTEATAPGFHLDGPLFLPCAICGKPTAGGKWTCGADCHRVLMSRPTAMGGLFR